MGKDNTIHVLEGKKACKVSTSGIFKKRESDTAIKDGHKRLRDLPLFLRPKKRKPKPKPEHPLSAEFSSAVEDSRKCIEEKNTSQLDSARDDLIFQALGTMQHARNRMQQAHDSDKSLQRPLDDELLELTSRNGAVITMTLGKRMNYYRKLVKKEEDKMDGLFEQYAKVSSQIQNMSMNYSGFSALETASKKPRAKTPRFENVDQRDLVAALEAEKERVWKAAGSVGEKAIAAMRANEKELQLQDKRRLQQLCESMFGEDDG